MRDEDEETTYGDVVEREGVGPQSPPDRPLGAFDPTVTAAGGRRGRSLDERLAEEEGGGGEGRRTAEGELVDAGGDQGADDEPTTIGELNRFDGTLSPEEAAVQVLPDDEAGLGLTDDANDGYGRPD